MSTRIVVDPAVQTDAASSALPPAIDIRGVSHAYGPRKALQDVSLTVA